jgi:hypothetical protein
MSNIHHDEQWRIVPPIQPKNATTRDLRFNGLTELRRGGRTWAAVGTGEHVKAALRKRAEQDDA